MFHFFIGLVAFVGREVLVVKLSGYSLYAIKILYRVGWAVTIIIGLHLIYTKITQNILMYIGAISYELYLTHGYCFTIMDSMAEIPLYLVSVFIPAIILNKLTVKMKYIITQCWQ